MRLRINVELDVPRWLRNAILGLISATSLLGLGLGVKAWAAPVAVQSFGTNEMLTADKLNNQFKLLQDAVNQSAPPGTIVAFGGPIDGNPGATSTTKPPPTGWLWCNGDAISRTQYAALFGAITIAHGGGDGVSSFNLPDYRGRFLRGVDGTAGADPDAAGRTQAKAGANPGNAVGSVQLDAFGLHDHSGGVHTHTASASGGAHQHDMGFGMFHWQASSGSSWIFYVDNVSPGQNTVYGGGSHSHDVLVANSSATIVPSGGSETRPKNAYVNYIIKY